MEVLFFQHVLIIWHTFGIPNTNPFNYSLISHKNILNHRYVIEGCFYYYKIIIFIHNTKLMKKIQFINFLKCEYHGKFDKNQTKKCHPVKKHI